MSADFLFSLSFSLCLHSLNLFCLNVSPRFRGVSFLHFVSLLQCLLISVFWEVMKSLELIFYYVESALFLYFQDFSSPLLAYWLQCVRCFLSSVDLSHILVKFSAILPPYLLLHHLLVPVGTPCHRNEVDLCGYKPGPNYFMFGEKPKYRE